MKLLIPLLLLFYAGNNNRPETGTLYSLTGSKAVNSKETAWQSFLQHLPTENAPIRDYKGRLVSDQEKHAAIIKYDVGNKDLQQCADALMRLRSEYLFKENRYSEIGFHFTTGNYYSWEAYCEGQRPSIKGQHIKFVATGTGSPKDHASLRKYLDILYAYANTVSLEKELKDANDFTIGTVIIKPGYPGHTCIIIDEKSLPDGRKLYKLAEGYMPAQSIYILNNTIQPWLGAWYALKKGPITTASFEFDNYSLKKFE